MMSEPDRESLKLQILREVESTLDDRVSRYLSVDHQRILGGHHFAHASTECVKLYRDGYFHSCITVTQSVAEGIVTFVGDRNGEGLQPKEKKQDFAKRMCQAGLVSPTFVDAFDRIQASYRNDFHHMNPPVAGIDLELLARRNIEDLTAMEREIFGTEFGDGGTIRLLHPKYWDVNTDGTVLSYVRFG